MYQELKPGQKYGHGRKSEDLDKFSDAKELLANNIVVIDIDVLSSEQIDSLLSTFNISTQYRTTDRGVHLYYKYDGKLPKDAVCGLGFRVEYKKKEVVVKRNNLKRKTTNQNVFNDIPNYFKPTHTSDLLDMVDGEGRYNSLFKLNIALLRNNVDDRAKILHFINDNIFAEKIDENQIKNAQRLNDNAVIQYLEKPHEKVKFLIDKYNPTLYNDMVYMYIDGFWKNNPSEIRSFLYSIFDKLSTTQIDELYKQLEYRLVENTSEYNVVKLKNGILKNGKFIEVNYKDFTPFHINLNYEKDVKCDEIDFIMQKITGNKTGFIHYIYSVVAQSFNLNFKRRSKQPYFHIFYGDGGNGKSILMKLISEIFNDTIASTVKPDQFNHNSNVYTLFGKLVNIGDDIKNEPLKPETLDIIKNVSSCDKIAIREIYKNTQNMKRVHANLIYSSNHLLSSWEKGTSFTRRIKWVPLRENVKQLVESGVIEDDVFDAIFSANGINYFFKKVIEAYFKVYSDGFAKIDEIEEFNDAYHENNDNSNIYIDALTIEDIDENTPKTVYEGYEAWCISQDFKASSKKRFKEVLFKHFDILELIHRVDGKPKRVYKATTKRGKL